MPEMKNIGVIAMSLLLLVIVFVPGTWAADGNEVSGFYRVTDAVHNGPNVEVTVRVRLINHTATDITARNVIFRFGRQQASSPQKVDAISLQPRVPAELTQKLTMNEREYQAWTNVPLNSASFELDGPDGVKHSRTIPLNNDGEPKQPNGGR
jgi:hypothetical protein